MQKVYIILLNWNGERDTCDCIASLLNLEYAQFDIVVCDNASEKKSVAFIEAFCIGLLEDKKINGFESIEQNFLPRHNYHHPKNITLIHTGSNRGFAGGVNIGLAFAERQGDADYYWILNNDCIVDPQSLSELVLKFDSAPVTGICGSTLVYAHDRKTIQALGGAKYHKCSGASYALGAFQQLGKSAMSEAEVEANMSYVVGASMLVRRQLIDVVGLMDERYFLYSEEHDWAYRAVLRGFKLGYASKSVVYHKHGASIGSDAKGGSPKSLYYLYRSKILFTKKFYPLLVLFVIFNSLFVALKFLVKGNLPKGLAIVQAVLIGKRAYD
ncbi:glycosyltransferase family 2 protein [Methylophilus aquaticus]|uniref:Glycosyltransferase family 2 protein n=1 Tax=Methylophilus aquaticus TaxID=1971610 RepID=A0ABT9JT73_9PROT|nr:glycosyltransferase family 2 protein [Methylophilus aquaticus]MDP8567782.1 glycosyltransferase family 2 protein [Methylophilus aquaticus]